VRRREFITLGGAAAAWPIAARAQHASDIARIGVLNTGLDDAVSGGLGYRAFVAKLQKLGFAEGRNLAIDYGRTDQGPDKAFAAATAMVRSNVAVIVASGSELPLQAAVAASASIPVVMLANSFDPITRGYVASLARPGGNITGVFYRQPELAQKRVELLAEAFPARRRLAVLWDATSSETVAAAEQTARTLNLQVHSTKLERPPYDFDAAFQDMASANP
jgi:putative tryptophan/tyrosine transport system substrate-binding protein